jgi:glycerophosphoryl diester phosphodiesterase
MSVILKNLRRRLIKMICMIVYLYLLETLLMMDKITSKLVRNTLTILFLSVIYSPQAPSQIPDPGEQFLYVAHRGASWLAPENTLASINLAWNLGADAVECDVMLTSDNQVLLFHDKNSMKLTGESHVVAETPWEILTDLTIQPSENNLPEYEGEGIPLLKDVLPTIPRDRMLVIEIKTGREILPFLKEVVDKHWKSGKISFIAFDLETIQAVKSLYPDVPCYYLSAYRSDVNRHFKTIVEAGLDGLDLRHAIICSKIADRCRKAGLDLWCWTVNDPRTAVKMKNLGVTAVTTDRPGWLREQLASGPGQF